MSAPTAAEPQQLIGLPGLLSAVGRVLGVSSWLRVGRGLVDQYAAATASPVPATAGAAPTTGRAPDTVPEFLTLSLLPGLARQNYRVVGTRMALNYGLERVGFPAPLLVGESIRARTELLSVDRAAGSATVRFRHTVEVTGSDRPVCVADMLVRYLFDSDEPERGQVQS